MFDVYKLELLRMVINYLVYKLGRIVQVRLFGVVGSLPIAGPVLGAGLASASSNLPNIYIILHLKPIAGDLPLPPVHLPGCSFFAVEPDPRESQLDVLCTGRIRSRSFPFPIVNQIRSKK